MNIEGVNLLSLLSAASNTEGGTPSLPEKNAITENFTNALIGQIKMLSATKGQTQLPGQLQNMTMPQTVNSLDGIGDLLKNKVAGEELSALIDKYLPSSYKKIEDSNLNKDGNLETTLLALTDTLKSMPPGMIPDELAAALNSGNINIMASNGLSPEKQLPEGAKLNLVGGEFATSGDSLQNGAILPQLIKDGQGFNLQAMQNTEPTEKTPGVEKHVSNPEPEKTMSGLTADMIPFHSPVEIKTDSPAISRPLDHPGWNKDLGEQIVWMNNKTMSAAEIKLNPEHLGPISVRIDIHQDQASIMFTANHAEVKEALESSIPKLREMLGAQQLNLINVNISQNSTPDQGRSQSQPFLQIPENHEHGINGVIDSIDERVVVSKGLLSIYA